MCTGILCTCECACTDTGAHARCVCMCMCVPQYKCTCCVSVHAHACPDTGVHAVRVCVHTPYRCTCSVCAHLHTSAHAECEGMCVHAHPNRCTCGIVECSVQEQGRIPLNSLWALYSCSLYSVILEAARNQLEQQCVCSKGWPVQS